MTQTDLTESEYMDGSERIQQDELELIQRAFRKIKVATLAERMGMETAAAIAGESAHLPHKDALRIESIHFTS